MGTIVDTFKVPSAGINRLLICFDRQNYMSQHGCPVLLLAASDSSLGAGGDWGGFTHECEG